MLTRKQRTGRAKPSFLGQLLDDYDAAGVVDSEHENELKLVGAAMYAGEHFFSELEVSGSHTWDSFSGS